MVRPKKVTSVLIYFGLFNIKQKVFGVEDGWGWRFEGKGRKKGGKEFGRMKGDFGGEGGGRGGGHEGFI